MNLEPFVLLGIVGVLLISGCTTDTGNSISNGIENIVQGKNCFALSDVEHEGRATGLSTKAQCNTACIENGYIPGEHKTRDIGGYTTYLYYDCQCCDGDIKSLGCIYETANVLIADYNDVEISKSDCDELCESYGFLPGEPEEMSQYDTRIPGWHCKCFLCSEEFTQVNVEKCYYDTAKKEISHCYKNGTRTDLGTES